MSMLYTCLGSKGVHLEAILESETSITKENSSSEDSRISFTPVCDIKKDNFRAAVEI